MREFVELIWVLSGLTLAEQMSVMWPRHGRVPYPARYGQTRDGDPWDGEILCGGDPYLRARIVDDLSVERGPDGGQTTTWRERPRPRGRSETPWAA